MKNPPADFGGSMPMDVPVAASAARSRAADFLSLTKPRLNFLVLITTMVGFYLGAQEPSAGLIFHTLVGTALVAGAASVLNQVWERDTDGLMRRTRLRPLPDKRLRPAEGARFGLALAAIGLVELTAGANFRAAVVAAATLVSYVLAYTPLKRRTSLATIVGAVPGALPPVIGWAAATNTLSLHGWILFAIVFVWQMPHFLAIGWMFRDDYANAGIPLLPVIEPDGRSTGRQALIYAAALVPVSLAPVMLGMAGPWYLAGALVLGGLMLTVAARFADQRTMPAARAMFFGSILYLPLLWVLLILDRARAF